MVVGARQSSFQFFRENTWFLKNIREFFQTMKTTFYKSQHYTNHSNHLKDCEILS